MDEFLISGATLTDIADRMRENLKSQLIIDPNCVESEGRIIPGSVEVFYKEYIDYSDAEEYAGIVEGPLGDTFVAYGLAENPDGEIVLALYDTDLESDDPEHEPPDYEEPFFYMGTSIVDGVLYDRWRKIETTSSDFTQDSVSQHYVYTNRVVIKAEVSDTIYPQDMPSKVDEVYATGYHSGHSQGYNLGYTAGKDSAIVEVDELPDPDGEVSGSVLYKFQGNYYKKSKKLEEVYYYSEDNGFKAFTDAYFGTDVVYSCHYLSTMPNTELPYMYANEYHLYFVNDEAALYVCGYGSVARIEESIYLTDNYADWQWGDGYYAVVVDGWQEFVLTEGMALITENGIHNVSGYFDAKIDVPIPEEYIIPTGKIILSDNGTYDVSDFAEAEVNVPTGGTSFTVEGKAIPINEHVERIYFNINNSVEETDAILSKLTYIENVFENPTAFVYGDTTDGYTGLFIGAWKFDDTHYAIGFFDNLESMSGEILYATPGFIGNDESRYNGWLKQGYAPLDLTFNSMGVYGSSIPEFLGFPIGSENELVKNVLSVVPFAAPSNNVATEGTPIPRGEVVEKIYFNTNNTAEETLAILSQLTYIQTPLVPYPINVIYGNTADGATGSVIYAIKYSDTEIAIQELQNINSQNFLVLFNSDSTTLRGAGFNGWNFTTVLGFNPGSTRRNEEIGIHSMNVYAEGQALTDFNGIPIGVENEKLKNVLSITPFAVASSKEDFEGTAIVSGEAVEKVYFNINNTMEETNEVLSQLTYVQTPFLQHPIYPIFAYVDPNGNGYTGKFIFAVNSGHHYEINYCEDIANQSFVYLYATQFGDTYEGWSYCNTIGDVAAEGVPAFIELNVAGTSEWGGLTVGAENDKIKNVLSLTPFVNGYDKGYNDGIEQGKQAQYDAFWDAYQQNGTRTYYSYGFSGYGWTDETFKPKYPIQVTAAEGIFYLSCIEWADKIIQVDFSKVQGLFGAFYGSHFKHIGKCDLSAATNIGAMFNNSRACSIEEIVSKDNLVWSNVFGGAVYLEDITFSGVIGTSISFINSPLLTAVSVDSIIDHLKDLTGQTAQTLTFHTTVKGKLTDAQKSAITAKNWQLG